MQRVLVLYLHQDCPDFARSIYFKPLEAPSNEILLSIIAVTCDQVVYNGCPCMILCPVSLEYEKLVLKFFVLTLEYVETVVVGLE